MKKKLIFSVISILMITAVLVIFAYARTWDKTELEIKIKINEKLVQESTFGESPTFAIWLEDSVSKIIQPVFVTRRAAQNDWEGKVEVPVALPKWFDVVKLFYNSETGKDNIDGFTGATPKPGYFVAKKNLIPGTNFTCWIEVNLAGDFNENYQQINIENKTSDEYLSGQPALIYKAEISAIMGKVVQPVIVGMSILNSDKTGNIQPLKGITTAQNIFSEIELSIVKPKPKIITF